MSRKERVLKKRYAIFCEGDTEYNYIDKMRKNQGVELVLKPINMHGGGYSNFLRQIKKEAQSNYLAKFIIVDADRIKTIPGEQENFIVNVWKFKDIAAFKSNEDVYEFLNSGNKSYGTQVFTVVNVPIHIFWHKHQFGSIKIGDSSPTCRKGFSR